MTFHTLQHLAVRLNAFASSKHSEWLALPLFLVLVWLVILRIAA